MKLKKTNKAVTGIRRRGEKVVTISFSCKPETYKKIMIVKEQLETDRLEDVPLSHVIDRLVVLGFAYRESLKLNTTQKEPLDQTQLVKA